MDDNEYYAKMRKQYSYDKKISAKTKKTETREKKKNFSSISRKQGKEDAEMLMFEKTHS